MENKPKILVVDDEYRNLELIEAILLPFGYELFLAKNGPEALKSVVTNPPDLILLDIMMPGMDGYEVCRRLKSSPVTKKIPVIFVTGMDDTTDEAMGFKLGAADYITKPIRAPVLRARVETQIALYDQNRVLEEKVQQRTAELVKANSKLEKGYFQTVELTFDLLNLYDEFLGGHCKRVAMYANLIARKLEFDEKTRRDLIMAALLHDIGLAGFPSRELIHIYANQASSSKILFQYHQHPQVSAKLLAAIDRFSRIAEIIATHHENMDGSGFPNGLTSDEIPKESRIIAVVDRYDQINKLGGKAYDSNNPLSFVSDAELEKYDGHIIDIFKAVLEKGDPFSRIVEIDLKDIKTGMRLAKPVSSVEGINLLSTGTILREDHIDIIMRYAGYGKFEGSISVYATNI